jgi:hypothetical protein
MQHPDHQEKDVCQSYFVNPVNFFQLKSRSDHMFALKLLICGFIYSPRTGKIKGIESHIEKK